MASKLITLIYISYFFLIFTINSIQTDVWFAGTYLWISVTRVIKKKYKSHKHCQIIVLSSHLYLIWYKHVKSLIKIALSVKFFCKYNQTEQCFLFPSNPDVVDLDSFMKHWLIWFIKYCSLNNSALQRYKYFPL